jgi:hypothetical protein
MQQQPVKCLLLAHSSPTIISHLTKRFTMPFRFQIFSSRSSTGISFSHFLRTSNFPGPISFSHFCLNQRPWGLNVRANQDKEGVRGHGQGQGHCGRPFRFRIFCFPVTMRAFPSRFPQGYYREWAWECLENASYPIKSSHATASFRNVSFETAPTPRQRGPHTSTRVRRPWRSPPQSFP